MADKVITKPLGLVLIATAHMVFGHDVVTVTGILCGNITLNFTFNDTVIDNNSHFAIYVNQGKIAEYTSNSRNMLGDIFDIYPNTSIRYHISKLELNQSGDYLASLFLGMGSTRIKESDNKVRLIVQLENSSSTVCPPRNNTTTTPGGEGTALFSLKMITVLVISSLLLAVALFLLLIWLLVRVKDRRQQHIPQQNSNTTAQDTVNISNCPAVPPLVYSVLDFPKRPAAVSVNSEDTEYVNVSYVPERMHSSMQT